jgi:hypothetical protein
MPPQLSLFSHPLALMWDPSFIYGIGEDILGTTTTTLPIFKKIILF